MLRRFFFVALLFALGPSAFADGLQKFLSLRSKFGVTSLCSPEAVAFQPHGTVVEVSGRITGVSLGDNGEICILEYGDQSLVIRAIELPGWFRPGSPPVRLLVRIDAEGKYGMPDLLLVAAVGEEELAAHEARVRRSAETKHVGNRTRAETQRKAEIPAAPIGQQLSKEVLASIEQVLPGYKAHIRNVNKRLTDWEAEQIAKSLLVFSAKHGVDPRLVTAVVVCESGFDPAATSPKGAAGLGQLMPLTAQGMGVRNPYDTNENLEATVRLLRGHMLKYKPRDKEFVDMRTLATALAAYNAGSGAVRRYGGIPPYRETQGYIAKVISLYRRLCGE